MDYTKLGPLLTGVGTSLIGGGVVAVPATAPAWVQGVLVVIGVVMVASGQYLSHQSTKAIVKTQDDHEDAIKQGAAIDKATGNELLVSTPDKPVLVPPAGSLAGVIQPTAVVPTVKP